MKPRLVSRRALLGGATALAALQSVRLGRAMGRVPIGGQLHLRVPWSTRVLDPHDGRNALAAFFGHAVADPVFALDSNARPYPTLAEGMPRIVAGETTVRLRAGLRTAHGKPLDGRDLAWSVARARAMGASGWLGPLDAAARSSREDPLLVQFGAIDPDLLASLLASPLVALLPEGFSPRAPDATGGFAAVLSAAELALRRNAVGARGPSFLSEVIVESATELADSLRAFEAGHDDIGWLGLGLYGDRPGATRFDYGEVGWVVLATGKAAGRLHTPGVAQQLANAVPVEQLRHLGLRPRRGLGAGALWSEGAASVLVDETEPHLGLVAKSVASELSRPGHELVVGPTLPEELSRVLETGEFSLAVHAVRRAGPGPLATLIALASAERATLGRDLARHPPRLRATAEAHELTGTLRLGVLGGLGVSGGAGPGVLLAPAPAALGGLDLGSSYRHS
jgi:peptide/nickel transport system substrate-binding protein